MKPSLPLASLAACLSGAPILAQSTGEAPSSGIEDTLDPTVIVADGDDFAPEGSPLVNTQLGLDSKLPYSIFETPRSVETVTREEFTQRGAQNLEEASRYVTGVQSGYYGLDTRQDFVRIRGLNALNYRDGLQYNFNFYNNTPIEPYALEQVDFIKGPASILFGRGTVGGTVNTTSKVAGPNARNEFMLGYGTYDRFQTGIDYNRALNADGTLFLRLVGYYRNSDTYVDYVNDDSQFFMPSLTWQPSDDTSLSLLLNLQENESKPSLGFFPIEATQIPGETLENETYGGEPSLDRYNTDQTSGTLLFDHRFNDTYSISSTMRYLQSSADYVEHTLVPPAIGESAIAPLPAGTYHRILYGSDHETDVYSGNVVLEADYETGPISHDIRLGTDFTRAERDRNTLPANPQLFGLPYVYANFIDLNDPTYGTNSVPLPSRTNNLSVTEDLLGVFLHDRIRWENLIVSAGARFDSYEFESNQQPTDDQENWSFDAGLMYQLPQGISPYYSYAESFEPQGISPTTNEPLEPKEGTQHEFGVKWMPCEETLLVASYFEIEEANRVFSGPVRTTQSSSVEVDGAEFSLRHRYHDLYFRAGYTYLDTSNHDLEGSPQLTGVPTHQASGWATYNPQEGPLANFRAGLGVRYTGTRSDGFDVIQTGAHTLVDAMIGYRWKNVDIQLNVSNLFDEQYIQTHDTTRDFGLLTTNAFLGQDRSINLTTRVTF